MLRTFCVLAILAATSSVAQKIGFGVKGGFRASDDIQGSATSESKRYVVGPMLEVALPLRLGIEIDALYSRLGYRTGNGNFAGGSATVARANSWEFPMLLKYRLPFPLIHPYLSGGYSLRHAAGSSHSEGYTINLSNGNIQTYSANGLFSNAFPPSNVSHGAVVGGGVEFGRGHLRFAPEARYTYWNRDIINIQGSQGYFVQASQNQAQILLGISWR